MARKFVTVLYVLYLMLCLVLAASTGLGLGHWLLGFDSDLITMALNQTIWWAAALGVVVLLRWWVRSATWRTFSVLTLALAIGCLYKGTYLHTVSTVEQVTYFFGTLLWLFAVVFAAASITYFAKYLMRPCDVCEEIHVDERRVKRNGSQG